jgi:hypothetical protein
MKMRLGRTAWLVLGIGVFVIVFATLLVIYSRQSGEGAEMEKNLAGSQTQLTNLILGRESLEDQLAQQQSNLSGAQALLSSAQGSFPTLEASIEYGQVLSDLADAYNLEVVSMQADKPREKEVDDVTFLVVSFEVEVRGEVNSVLGMVNAITKDKRFVSTTVEVVDIKVPEPQSIIAITSMVQPEKPTAKIKLVGYSYGGE